MSLKLYNSLTKQVQEFTPLKKGQVTMYTCGPTVYSRPHIGNYSSFLLADLLRRWLEASGYKVTHAKNITDVGHLVNDGEADADGEDKLERQAKAEKGTSELEEGDVLAIAEKYTQEYLDDEKALNFIKPEFRPKATEVVEDMIKMIEVLIEKEHAYETDDGVYFCVDTFKNYGQLSGNTVESLSAGARVEVDEHKKHPADFALWKKCVGVNCNHVLKWDSPWGKGFPGWHIECSVMSREALGEQIDIHTGGEDLIFPHHECEIAQSEGAGSPSPCIKYWVHRRFIDMGDTKMSKSLGNVLTLDDVIALGYSAMDLRYYLLSVHYRTNLKFTEKGLEDAKKARRKVVEWISDIRDRGSGIGNTNEPITDHGSPITEWVDKFTEAMNSDLNTPGALAVIFDCMAWSRSNNQLEACSAFVDLIEQTFGCFVKDWSDEAPAEVQVLLEERLAARVAKDFARSDELRDDLKSLGYEVRDEGDTQTVKKL